MKEKKMKIKPNEKWSKISLVRLTNQNLDIDFDNNNIHSLNLFALNRIDLLELYNVIINLKEKKNEKSLEEMNEEEHNCYICKLKKISVYEKERNNKKINWKCSICSKKISAKEFKTLFNLKDFTNSEMCQNCQNKYSEKEK
jgi:ribosomal protein L37AE/L43A